MKTKEDEEENEKDEDKDEEEKKEEEEVEVKEEEEEEEKERGDTEPAGWVTGGGSVVGKQPARQPGSQATRPAGRSVQWKLDGNCEQPVRLSAQQYHASRSVWQYRCKPVLGV
uniref:Uncharacterized protein n=1 Tax=Vespula pensylvanica TaxID=30213 RepID=A0A834KCZ0_VESPE|nr:hypothetical protein H0235_015117 [Vespula pensylvanica]